MPTSVQMTLLPKLISDINEQDHSVQSRGKRGTHHKAATSGTFKDNMKLPIHRWFRYSAGFSAEWAEAVIRLHSHDKQCVVLDPFAGSGTTLLAAERTGVLSIGYESHPFVSRIAKAKLLWHLVNVPSLVRATAALISSAAQREIYIDDNTAPLLTKCFTESNLSKLFSLRQTLLEEAHEEHATLEIIWLAITAILRSCSHVGTAQWQYVLPNKTKSNVLDPLDALKMKIEEMANDISYARNNNFLTKSTIIDHDARKILSQYNDCIDLVVTSPPYPNNYDYADATRLEMTFWGEIESWSDLQEAVRKHIIRSCSQHSAAERLRLDDLLSSDEIKPIHDELATVCNELDAVRLTKGGRKTYHTMIAAYFVDMAKVFCSLRSACKEGASLCFVIGDSAPYGVYVPADQWMGKLAINAGFNSFTFEKLRDRNVKWKNRKHTVPLKEGRLWIKG